LKTLKKGDSLFEGLKIRLGMWLLKPPKPLKIKKNTICHMCKKNQAVIADEWFMRGLPLCEECNRNLRIMDYNISRSMGDFDWMEDYKNLVVR
jgi:hypothetical protein